MNNNLEIDGRKVVCKALFGSHNYNLNTEDSDKDWKYFVLPTFDDLYNNTKVSKSVVTDEEDYEVKDVRLLVDLLRKANPAYLELLYSVDIQFYNNFDTIGEWLLNNRDVIVKANPKGLFNATTGTILNKCKYLYKGNQSNQDVVAKLGYSPKDFHHMVRCSKLLTGYRFEENNMGKELYYEDNDEFRTTLLGFKNGDLSLEEVKRYHSLLIEILDEQKDYYYNQPSNLEIFDTLDNMIYDYVKQNLERI